LQARVDALLAEGTQLREQLAAAKKNSSTSSKPPSSDIVKLPPADEFASPRRVGGQPGHSKHERVLFPPSKSATSRTIGSRSVRVAVGTCTGMDSWPELCNKWTLRNRR
jgi:transposase